MGKFKAIDEGIQNRDVKALREALGNICYTSSDFSSGEFDDALRQIEMSGIDIKDSQLIGNPLISSQKQSFTDEDFSDAVFELKENFCDERIRDVKIIGKSLAAENKINDSKTNTDVVKGMDPNLSSHPQNTKLWIAIGVVAVILIIVVIWII